MRPCYLQYNLAISVAMLNMQINDIFSGRPQAKILDIELQRKAMMEGNVPFDFFFTFHYTFY